MKYTLTKRDVGILLGFLGIVILGLTYYFVYFGYKDKTTELKNANAGLQSRVDVLQSIADQQDSLISDTRNYEQLSERIFDRYPAGFQDEDGFMLAVDLQAVSPFDSVSTVTNSDPTELYNFEDVKAKTDEMVKGYIPEQNSVPPSGENSTGEEATQEPNMDQVENAAGGLPGLRFVETIITCTCDYPSFKNGVAYIIDKDEKHSIQIQGVYDITTGILASTYTIKSPYLINTDKVYTEPELPFIVQGTENIFGTIPLQTKSAVTYGTTRNVETGSNAETKSQTLEASEED